MCLLSGGQKRKKKARDSNFKNLSLLAESDMTLISRVTHVSILSLVQLLWGGCSLLAPLGTKVLRSPDGFHKCDGFPSLIHKIICCTHCQWKCSCKKSFTLHARFCKSNKSSNIKPWLISHGLSLILWFLTMKTRHGTWGRNLMQLPCSKHCLNWKEEGITPT